RHESLWHSREPENANHDQYRIHRERDAGTVCHTRHDLAVAIGCPAEETVERVEQPAQQAVHHARWRIFRRSAWLEEHRGKRRRQRQRVERRDQRREGDGKSELPVELAVETTDER